IKLGPMTTPLPRRDLAKLARETTSLDGAGEGARGATTGVRLKGMHREYRPPAMGLPLAASRAKCAENGPNPASSVPRASGHSENVLNPVLQRLRGAGNVRALEVVIPAVALRPFGDRLRHLDVGAVPKRHPVPIGGSAAQVHTQELRAAFLQRGNVLSDAL